MKKQLLIWQRQDNLEISLIGFKGIDKVLLNSFSCKTTELSRLYKRFNLQRLPATLIIPRDSVIVRFLEVPSSDPEEIGQMIEFQATKELPFSKEEMVLGYRILGTFREGYSAIMLAVLKEELAERNTKFIESLGGFVAGIALSTEYIYLWAIENSVIKKESTAILLDIDFQNLELLVISKNRLVFSRPLFDGSRLVEELERSILTYKKERVGPDIEEIVVTSRSASNLEEVSKLISKELGITTRCFVYSNNHSLLKETPQIVLLPKGLLRERTKANKQKNLIATVCLGSISVLLLFGIFSFRLYEKTTFLSLLDTKVKEVQSEAGRLEKMLQQTEIVKSHIKDTKLSLDILAELYRIIPGEIYLTSITYDEGRAVILKGLSRDMQEAFLLIKSLEDSKYFKKVELKFASSRKVSGQEMTDFQIICEIEKIY